MTPVDLAELVARSRAEQGLGPKVADPAVVSRVAAVLGPPPPERKRRRRGPTPRTFAPVVVAATR